MAKPGTKPRSHLQVVREGNPGKRTPRESLKLEPAELEEPDWHEWWPVVKPAGRRKSDHPPATIDRHDRARSVAANAWHLVVEQLEPRGVLADIDELVLTDLAICVARIDECERDISENGIWTQGERGAQKNPSTTAANQYRSQLKFYVAELGLSPSSRERLTGGGDGDEGEGDAWD